MLAQPGSYDGGTNTDRVAELERFIPLLRETMPVECPVAGGMAAVVNRILKLIRPAYEMRFYKKLNQYNIVDCAVAKPVNPGIIGDGVIGLGKIAGVGELRDGITVQKSGRSSGITSGEVSATGVTVKVELSDEESGWFSDQVVADLVCKPGDSGSLVLDKENKAVGLLFAGSDSHCIVNRIQNVMKLLEVEL